MEEKEQFKHLYNLYLNNQCSAAELKQFFELLNKSNTDLELLTLMSNTWDQTNALPEEGLIPPFLKSEPKQIKLTLPQKSYFSLQKWIGVAALLILLTGTYFYRSAITNIFNSGPQYQLVAAASERKQLQLADGTKVWLSPNSKLSYPDKFEGPERSISLDGEAFFEVTHDARHPFIIKSGAVSTTVLGTSFNVTAYTQQHTIAITLVTGRVAVALNANNHTQRDTITANQRITVDKTTSKITKINYPDAASFLSKRLGLYEYKGTTLEAVSQDLENQYNIKIQLDQELSSKAFYGNLNMSDPLNETLNKLCTVMETKWKKDGGHYAIIK
ncbi:MAG: FecR domain-containing protein [Candidatus Pedobacter colombiensis]|uniref:FecR domain-containing protein n=1 Tax=Candidatus Pedobacter colombiensis TaxID=3121371 RepID=A0AAJ5W806_9SPHI|nr:FecR family protein [Pedobacter sp.]WEK18775.1 MAG: FecR domain-containing protein [Pedobacter sp.]